MCDYDPELEGFKSKIDLREFAAYRGYELDRKESWRGSAVMRHTNGDKIIIKRDSDDHYVYFSVRDERDNGSIIDFLQRRERLTLGGVRVELREWLAEDYREKRPVQGFLPLRTDRERPHGSGDPPMHGCGVPSISRRSGRFRTRCCRMRAFLAASASICAATLGRQNARF